MKLSLLLAIIFGVLHSKASDFYIGTWKLSKEYCGPYGAPPQQKYGKYELTLNEDGSFSEVGIFNGCNFNIEGNFSIENGSEIFFLEKKSVDCNGPKSLRNRLNNIKNACRYGSCIQIYNTTSPGCSSRVYMQGLDKKLN